MGSDLGGPRAERASVPSPHAPGDPPLSPQAAAQDDRSPDAESLELVARSLAAVPTGDETDDDADGTTGTDDAEPAPGEDVSTDPADPPADPASPTGAPDGSALGPVTEALTDTRHAVEDLNAAERLFLAQQRALLAELCPAPQDPVAVGALFDRVRAQWAQATDRPDPRGPVEAFGVALGDLLAARLPELSWAACTDRYGTEMVLARRDPELLVYPVAAVAQAWEDAHEGWLVTHLRAVVRGVSPGTGSDV